MRPIHYIAVPLWQGAEKRGVEMAPQALMEGGLDAIMQRYAAVTYQEVAPIPDEPDKDTKYTLIARFCQTLKQVVAQSLREGVMPFCVGGDHALGLGSVAAAAEQYDDLGLIWFDAHGDMNTESGSKTGHIHGMPVAALMGLCSSEVNEVATRRMKPDHIFWIGTRSLDPGEQALIDKLHLHVYTAEYVRQKGMDHVMAEVRQEIQRLGITHLHCSFDVDAMDPTIVSATGVAESNGLTQHEYATFVHALAQLSLQLTSIDLVEYNPLLDDANKNSRAMCLQAVELLLREIS